MKDSNFDDFISKLNEKRKFLYDEKRRKEEKLFQTKKMQISKDHQRDLIIKRENDKIPILNNFPKDVIGAGDSLLIISAISLAAGANPWEATLLGSIASGVQVGVNGNVPLTSKDITQHL